MLQCHFCASQQRNNETPRGKLAVDNLLLRSPVPTRCAIADRVLLQLGLTDSTCYFYRIHGREYQPRTGQFEFNMTIESSCLRRCVQTRVEVLLASAYPHVSPDQGFPRLPPFYHACLLELRCHGFEYELL